MSESVEIGGVSVDLSANLASEVNKYGGPDFIPEPWAADYAASPPIFHVGSLEGIRAWGQSSRVALQSHKRLHSIRTILQLPENTPGQTCAEDIKRGLNKYVFASLGRLAMVNSGGFAAVVLKPEVLSESIVSLRELTDFGGILVSPEERFGKHDETEVQQVNQRAFEQFISTLVAGSKFHKVFARYLTKNYASVEEFLSSHDFIPGQKDIPPRDSVAYKELIAQKSFFISLGIPTTSEVKEGYAYHGPQLMVANQVDKTFVSGVIVYSGDQNDRNAKATARAIERTGIAVNVLNVKDVTAQELRVAREVFARGDQDFRNRATVQALFNLSFNAAADFDSA